MIIRIFLPETVYRVKSIDSSKYYHIFGKIANDSWSDNISIFVVDIRDRGESATPDRQFVGTILTKSTSDTKHFLSDYVSFRVDGHKSVLEIETIHLPNFIATGTNFNTQILLYDSQTFSELSHRNGEQKWCQRQDPISQLLLLIKTREDFKKQEHVDVTRNDTSRNRFIPILITLSMFCETKLSFLNSSFLKHFQFWTSNIEKLTHNNVYIWTIILDVIAGIVTMLWLWRISNADEYLMQLTMFIVSELQGLLDALKGSPVGLKLNVDLNNFFIECFRYHIDLWATFLVIISPLVKYLFAPLAIIGCFGLSFQLSMLADLLSVITLHAHCIYTYASIVHKIEMNGLVGVWRVVSGRRKNILKGRIESFEYTNPQLYLSTIFFTALLFLLPTNLVYYVVFASLRFAIQCIMFLLTLAQRKLLSLPVVYIVKWCLGRYVSSEM
ncbi:phosphatidylinositol N-acetylglucosaminyltransferase subunit Q isoform X2 [Sitodiplosis mosellana]|uniref:phosphatidylinositol N-acetylglucosaminyltransferase subunit Q isoform X2 n=1 Tax=Sitodiplosis mosellana TaxID=263140 RepID=UPI002444184A|nr:phosphatidylinositol N-acetylglucosaminyltransferase subunit Q isoform X2 [Sitodiplosis mosellana]